MPKVAIVAALEREVSPLVRGWRASERQHDGRNFRFFEEGDVALVCGGIGPEAARRAAETAIALFQPAALCSAGFAGAVDPVLKVGAIVHPHRIVNASDGSSVTLETGDGVLVSFSSVAAPAQKTKLRESFAAQAVDMEAAAVAQAAQARGVAFTAVKAISDEIDFVFPALDRFVNSDGQFAEARFAWFAALRPWLWPGVIKLARNSQRASHALCGRLRSMIATQAFVHEPVSEVLLSEVPLRGDRA